MKSERSGNLERFLGGILPLTSVYEKLSLSMDLLSVEGLQSVIAKANSVAKYYILCMDNPCSVLRLAAGDADFSKALLYEKLQTLMAEADKQLGLSSQIYYAYPNLGVPSMFFSDAHLPSLSECDENEDLYEETKLQAFDVTKAIDNMVQGGSFPVYAPGYVVIFSRESLEELPSYTRFSNERNKQFQIQTMLYSNKVCKRAVTKEAGNHVLAMKNHADKLSELVKELQVAGKQMTVNSITNISDASLEVTFALEKGKSLEQLLDELIAEKGQQGTEEVAQILLDFCEKLQNHSMKAAFTASKEFGDIFGEAAVVYFADKEEYALPVTDIDLVCQNILIDEQATVIDYEWTFDFAVPVSYMVFRFLYFYLEAKHRRLYEKPVLCDLYEKAGITKEAREVYLAMETSFQRWVQRDAAILRNEYDLFGAPVLDDKALSKQRMLYDRMKFAIEDNMGNMCLYRGKQEEGGAFRFRVPLSDVKLQEQGQLSLALSGLLEDGDTELLRVGTLIEKDGNTSPVEYTCDGEKVSELLYLCGAKNSLVLQGLASSEDVLLLSIEIVQMSTQALQELTKEIEDLRFLFANREQQLSDMRNSASWKVTRPLRKLRGQDS